MPHTAPPRLKRRHRDRNRARLHSNWLLLLGALLLGALFYFWLTVNFVGDKTTVGDDRSYGLIISSVLLIKVLFLSLVFYILLRRIIFYALERYRPFSGASLQNKFTRVFLLLSLPSIIFHLLAGSFIANVFSDWSKGQYREIVQTTTHLATRFRQAQDMHFRDFSQIVLHNLPKTLAGYRTGAWTNTLKRRSTIQAAFIYNAEGQRLYAWEKNDTKGTLWPQPEPRLFALSRIIYQSSPQAVSNPSLLVPSQGVLWGRQHQNLTARHLFIPMVVEGTLINIELISMESAQVAQALASLKQTRNNQWLLTGRFLYVVGAFFLAMVLVVMLFASTTSGQLARHMTLTIEELNSHTQRIATGELGIQLETKHLGALDRDSALLIENFNRMSTQLQEQHSQITQNAKEVVRNHDQLQARNRLVELLLENMDAGILFLNAHGEITAFNRTARDLLTSTQTTPHLTKPSAQTLPKPLLRALGEFHEHTNASHTPYTTNISIPQPNAPAHFLEVRLHTLKDHDAAEGHLIILKDVAALRRTQRALAWQSIARRMAHEIKNPLTPIQLSIQRLQRKYKGVGEDGGTILEQSAEIILKQVNNLKRMVNEFSQFSRLPEGRAQLGNLNESIQEVLKLYAHALPANVSLQTHLAPNLPKLPFAAEQIQRMLINLIDNALAAVLQKRQHAAPTAGEGGDESSSVGKGNPPPANANQAFHITLSTSQDEPNQCVVLSVADDGAGIAEEVRESIFEPYATTKETGTGLGLAIVSQIVHDHQGSIQFHDNAPHGTVFSIQLPLIPNTATPPATSPHASSINPANTANHPQASGSAALKGQPPNPR